MSVENQVIPFIAKFLNLSTDKVTSDRALSSLVHESFVLIQLIVELQEALNVHLLHDDLAKVKTVGQLIAAIDSKKART